MIVLYETWTHIKSDIELSCYKSYNLYRKFQSRGQIGAVRVLLFTLKMLLPRV